MAINVSFKWNTSPADVAARIVSPAVKLYAASEWHRLYMPFVPMGDTGQLMSNVEPLTEGNMGVIWHKVPYANYQYNGHGFNFRRDKHPLASASWDNAAKAAGKSEALAQSIQSFIGR